MKTVKVLRISSNHTILTVIVIASYSLIRYSVSDVADMQEESRGSHLYVMYSYHTSIASFRMRSPAVYLHFYILLTRLIH